MSNAWSPFYWRDYVADTGHLTLAQHGAYLLLMAHYYMTGHPIPANAEQVHRICRCTTDADRRASSDVLAEFFTLDGEVHRHGRIDEELAKAVEISGKRRAAANAKHQKSRANAGANAQQVQVQMHTQPQPQPQKQERAGGAIAPFPSPSIATANRASQMPEGFHPKDSHRTLAVELGVNLDAAFAKFKDHHGSKGSTYKNWDLAFNSWLRKEQEFTRGSGRRGVIAGQSQSSDYFKKGIFTDNPATRALAQMEGIK